jgi:hypothetical protein
MTLCLLTLALVATSTAQAQTSTTLQQQITSTRHGIQWAKLRTWHWQDAAGITRSPAIRGVAGYHSIGYLRWVERKWNRRRLYAYKLAHRPHAMYRTLASSGGSVRSVICSVFGSACSEALAVVRCESGFSIHAVNGQYLGLFQMGSAERARFATIGYSTAYQQTVAAHNYYMVSGWAPWSCRP